MHRLLLSILAVALTACSAAPDYEAFVRDFYENIRYQDDSFLQQHCTPEMLQALEIANDYDNPGMAYWEFRSGYQDGPTDEHRIISVSSDGPWWTYRALDMGIEFVRSIRLNHSRGRIMIEDLRQFKLRDPEIFALVITDPNVIRLDVRRADEYAEGHVPGAINMDVESPDFEEQIKTLEKDRPVAVYCRSGRRSKDATEKLLKAGYTGYDLDGGFLAWEEAGKPVE